MDYQANDSSGTEDDLPHQNRIQRGGDTAGKGRPSVVGSVPYPWTYDEADMEDKIHELEQEAYSSVLRAFKAQADAITWEKESVITDLRKELRLSNEEHRKLLGRVNVDETIQRIREGRLSAGFQQGTHGADQGVHFPLPPSFLASHTKQKLAPPLPPQSFGGPSLFPSQSMDLSNQPPSSAAKHGPWMGLKSQKNKPSQIPPGSSSMKMQYPSSISAGRGQFGNRISSGSLTEGSFDSLIGRKVRTKWPGDNKFYEAVITDYNPVEGRYSLVYDMGTPNETSEWVNFAEISPGDIQWEGEDPGNFHQGVYGSSQPIVRETAPGAGRGRGRGRGRGLNKSQSRKDFLPSTNDIGDAGDDADALIEKVKKFFGLGHGDPMDIEKAKKLLKDREQEITNALARLANISDGEDDDGDLRHGHPMD